MRGGGKGLALLRGRGSDTPWGEADDQEPRGWRLESGGPDSMMRGGSALYSVLYMSRYRIQTHNPVTPGTPVGEGRSR